MSSTVRPGDWTCAECGNNNFARRDVCKMCNKAKSGGGVATTTAVLGKRPGDWDCACGELNFAVGSECRQCKRVKPGAQQPNATPAPSLPVEILCSIDIERCGPALSYGILMIGVCVGLADGRVLERQAFCWKVKPQREAFDGTTWDEFWCKHVDVLERIYANAIDNPLGAFVDFMTRLEATYGPFGRKHKKQVYFRFCGDNLPYDLGHISVDMAKAGYHFHVQEMFSDYVTACDPTERMRTMPRDVCDRITRACTAPHDHWAVSDATRNYELMVGVLKWMATQGLQ